VTELEVAARGLGCAVMCVAAVPRQGVSFWKKCGYKREVPLKKARARSAESNDDAPGGGEIDKEASMNPLEEPATALGKYLLANMLLFSDTPLVAKVLR